MRKQHTKDYDRKGDSRLENEFLITFFFSFLFSTLKLCVCVCSHLHLWYDNIQKTSKIIWTNKNYYIQTLLALYFNNKCIIRISFCNIIFVFVVFSIVFCFFFFFSLSLRWSCVVCLCLCFCHIYSSHTNIVSVAPIAISGYTILLSFFSFFLFRFDFGSEPDICVCVWL